MKAFLTKYLLVPLLRLLQWPERDPNDTDGDGQFG